jgi:phosphoribosylaminoimidazolecarboxamide formyltransferase/IMP cyclohydrolase
MPGGVYISVSNKSGIVAFAQFLEQRGWWFIATPGTANYLQKHGGVRCGLTKDHTTFPPLFGDSIKSMHPKILGGIAARTDKLEDMKQVKDYRLLLFDIVVSNFLPFQKRVESGASEEECSTERDLDGPLCVRVAAQNWKRVTVLTDPTDYALVVDEIARHGTTVPWTRQMLAVKAERCAAEYDLLVADWREMKFKEMEA